MKDLIGFVGTKLLGREAGNTLVIVDQEKEGYVIVDGNVKRRRCNLKHLYLSTKKLEINKGDSTDKVQEAMKKENLEVLSRKESKPSKEKPIKKSKQREKKPVKEKKPTKEKTKDSNGKK